MDVHNLRLMCICTLLINDIAILMTLKGKTMKYVCTYKKMHVYAINKYDVVQIHFLTTINIYTFKLYKISKK